MQNSENRLHYMDNLRAIVMLVGVFFHAALAYGSFFNEVWMSADTVNSQVLDAFAHFTHIFRMPLFFLISGFFAALLVSRRGVGGLLKNRAKRVLLPLVIFLPIVMAGVVGPMIWAVHHVENLSPFLRMIQSMTSGAGPQQSAPPSTIHLWFLYYLMFFYVLVWILGQAPLTRVKRFFITLPPVVALILLPLCLVPGLLLGVVPYAAPEGFLPALWAFGFFGLFFAYGYWMFDSMALVDAGRRYLWLLLMASGGLFALFYGALPSGFSFDYQNPPLLQRGILVLCTAYISVFMSLACLVMARRLLDKRNAVMRYISDASYWVYIIHLPILVAIQYWLLDQPGGWLFKFAFSSLATLAICTLSYALFVRWTPVGGLLNGQRKPMLRG